MRLPLNIERAALDGPLALLETEASLVSELEPSDARLCWVAYPKSGAPGAHAPGDLTMVHFPAIDPKKAQAGEPEGGERLEPADEAAKLWVPHWVVGNGDGRAILEASTGAWIYADLPVRAAAARSRLIFLLALILLAAFGGALVTTLLVMLVMILIAAVLGPQQIQLGGSLGLMAAVLILAAYSRRLLGVITEGFEEPVWRARQARFRLPTSSATVTMQQSAGYLLGMTAGAVVVTNLFAILFDLGPDPSLSDWLVTLSWAALGIGGVWFAKQTGWLPTLPTGGFQSFTDKTTALVDTTVGIVRYGIVPAVLAKILGASGLLLIVFSSRGSTPPQANDVLEVAVALAASFAIARSRLAARERWPIVTGAIAMQVADSLFGDLGGVVTAVLTVTTTLLLHGRIIGDQPRVLAALAIGIRFAIGASLGELLGLAGGAFLLGATGAVVGKVLGAQIFEMLAVAGTPEPPDELSIAPRPVLWQRTRERWGDLTRASIAVFLAVAVVGGLGAGDKSAYYLNEMAALPPRVAVWDLQVVGGTEEQSRGVLDAFESGAADGGTVVSVRAERIEMVLDQHGVALSACDRDCAPGLRTAGAEILITGLVDFRNGTAEAIFVDTRFGNTRRFTRPISGELDELGPWVAALLPRLQKDYISLEDQRL